MAKIMPTCSQTTFFFFSFFFFLYFILAREYLAAKVTHSERDIKKSRTKCLFGMFPKGCKDVIFFL